MRDITIPANVRTRLRDAAVSPAAYIVAVHLLDGDERQRWRTCRSLVEESGLTTHQVRQAARALKAAGLIDQDRRYANVAGRKTTETSYRLLRAS
ncbi:hypothetical protein OG723_44270 (plasmid) [Streptomyces sp. NBC_01278]|uniref:hypothetical protein n=1 Tax=Streptomyces sp. NBC_01278 TaxID=2903809 RepID=UPI002E376D71|nr:hypothetical protein [Streptomyces sp. NBC_01278]